MPALCGLDLEHPVMNAAGTCKSLDDVAELARSATAAVVVGSITVAARAGNAGATYHSGDGYSLNALGLPNRGLGYYREHLPEMARRAHAAGKPLVLSVAGFSVEDYAVAATAAAPTGVDLLEVNLACPNVWDGGSQKRIACFDLRQTAAICAAVDDAMRAIPSAVPYGVKISPFSDPEALASLAEVLGKLAAGSEDGPRYVCTSNTFPNALAFDHAGREVIGAGLAGLAGPALRPVALGQVRQLRRLLPDTVDIVGAGGVTTGRDVADFLRAGATAVQVSTAYWNRGEDPAVFGEIAADWAEHCSDA
ncbi:beta/alpha barrel domain-containing protein [Frankia nepalensis]|uniref:Dihydroorotate dehydrogenase n=1 Tax=Frankia nepalensis TaxID=1836974 RepID=A0A937RFY2_9ACTN|nr:dihydroorotate dehydrogenase [Frankia nepalensis]MBL7497224.1 dihydroorotate dehydrogenase [Frankia nepalensis]MBL7510341.1 dihydroorotate dehydrogenase [Frankia nepalensis]MBL7626679.1 dihydroorotate dehydrogenase [Frankia nepalensis]